MNWIYDIISVPFGWLLGIFYTLLNDNYFLALLLFTLFFKLVLLPTSITQQKSAAKNTRTRAKVQKLQKKYANDKQKLNEEMQSFYQEEGFGSMTGGCVPLLIQMPIIIGLYGAIYKPLSYILRIPTKYVNAITNKGVELGLITGKNKRLYEFGAIENIEKIQKHLHSVPDYVFTKINNFDFTIFGLQLGETPTAAKSFEYWMVPVAAFAAAFILSLYTYIRQRKTMPEMAKNPSMGCMMMFTPFISLWLAASFPVGIGIYWALNSLLSLIQMVILNYTHSPEKVLAKIMVKETLERRSKEYNIKLSKNAV